MRNTDAIDATGTMTSQKPFLEPLAFALLDEIRAWYQNPENEAEFQRWQAAREAQEGA